MNKKILYIFFVFSIVIHFSQESYAQFSREIINYQGIVRNPNGTPLGNTAISIRIGISNVSTGVEIEYWEVWNVRTNSLGMYQIQIGGLNPTASGPIRFNQIDWTTDYKYIKVEVDVNGGNDFALAGISQLSAVPYAHTALFAERTQELSQGNEGDILFYRDGKASFFSPFSQQIVLADEKTIRGKGTLDAPFEVGILDTEHIKDEAITTEKIKPGEDYEILRTSIDENGNKNVKWDKALHTGNVWVKIQNNLANPTFDIPELPAKPSQINIYRNGVQLLGKRTWDDDPKLYTIEEGKLTILTDGFRADDGTVVNEISQGDVLEIKWIK